MNSTTYQHPTVAAWHVAYEALSAARDAFGFDDPRSLAAEEAEAQAFANAERYL